MIDVWILGGYLGAGKTTALNELLCGGPIAQANPALIINEFGKIGVDGALVHRRELTRFEINKGSLFCICTKTDFLKALSDIAGSGKHQAVLIEATGIAEPVDIENFLTEGPHAGYFRLRGNLCVVDAAHFTQVAAYLKPAVSQVCWADGMIINKCDLVDAQQLKMLRTVLETMNLRAPVMETAFGKIKPTFLNLITHRCHSENLVSCAPEQIFAVSFSTNQAVSEEKFFNVLEKMKSSILRLKGNVAFDSGPVFVEVVCQSVNRRPVIQDISTQNNAATAFTVIVWNTDKDFLCRQFEECWPSMPLKIENVKPECCS
ncbi:MAG: GTP-binding protein [Sedimentisphaerales bacterium]|nr:GTP-binding protein [Sedimentisphaerales bacterium]